MKDYRVVWQIDIEADSPGEAAVIAKEIQLDIESEANFFDILDKESEEIYEVELTKVLDSNKTMH